MEEGGGLGAADGTRGGPWIPVAWRSISNRGGEVFSTLAYPVLAVAAVAAGVRVLGWTMTWVGRHVTVSAEFGSGDESYRWIMEWLADNDGAKRCGRWVATASKKGPEELVQYTPAPGTYWLQAGSGKWVFVTRQREDGAAGSSKPMETLRVLMLGRCRVHLDQFIAEAAANCRAKDLRRTLIYTGGEHGSWNMAKTRLRRPLESVILPGETAASLVRDVQDFLRAEMWYAEHGIPWKRGYLLHGVPGSGKTSFVTALAGHLGLNIYSFSLGNAGMTDDALQSLMITVPPRSIVLMEDLEAAFSRGLGGNGDSAASQLTLSGLLNALDGATSQEGSLTFLTTNFPQMLPERLLRSGRIDVRVEFGLATKTQVRQLFQAFYGPGHSELESAFVDAYPDQAMSMADLQGLLLEHKNSAINATFALKSLLQARGQTK